MNSQVRIRRSRGAVCGGALILLGLWGGLAPFVGHYLHFGFTPDKAWAYNTGRLYLSAVPGGAAILGGLAIILTRSRIIGMTGSLLAALGGAWFVAGAGITTDLLKLTSINAGSPLGYNSGAGPYTVHAYLEVLALFTGLGILIIFTAAVGFGRVSILSAKDAADAADAAFYPDYQTASGSVPEQASYPTVSRYPDSATDPFPEPSTGQFPTAAGKVPPASGQFTQTSLPASNSPFGEAPNPFTPEAPAQ